MIGDHLVTCQHRIPDRGPPALRHGGAVVLGMRWQVSDLAHDRGSDSFTAVARDAGLEALAVGCFQSAFELFEAHRYA